MQPSQFMAARLQSLQHIQPGLRPAAAPHQQQQHWGARAMLRMPPAQASLPHIPQQLQHPRIQVGVQQGTQHHLQRGARRQAQQGVVCFASSSGSGSSGSKAKQQQGPPDITNNMDDMDDVILVDDSDDEDDEFGADDDGFVDFDDDDDVIPDDDAYFDEGVLGIGSDEDPGPEVLTGNVEWGDKALLIAQEVLGRPENQNLALYLFRVIVPSKLIEIRLDKLDDVYGSPGLEDIERFSRALAQTMEAQLGAEAAGEISFEVSSPGAERMLILPQDLMRFKDLPMRVEYMSEVGQIQNLVLRFLELDELNSKTTWELADVKANQNVKGRGLSKKQRMQKYDIALEALERVRIYVDF